MKGLLAYSSETGLGRQTYEMYKNLHPDKVLLVDLEQYNRMPTNHGTYYRPRIVNGIPSNQDVEWLVDGVDSILICETPLNYHLYEYAKQRGVKVVQQFNPEFLDFFRHPNWPKPTILANPSTWMMDKVRSLNVGCEVIHLPVPINIQKQRDIKEVKTLFHIIGRPAVHDRNGTLSFLEAAKRLGNKYKYIVYYQTPKDSRAIEYFQPVLDTLNGARRDLEIEVVTDVADYTSLYSRGDLLVLPRRYGGLCLPAQEAMSFGIPVIMTDVSPNNSVLPDYLLCKAYSKATFFAHVDVEYFEADVDDLVSKIESIDINRAVRDVKLIADSLSWDNLKSTYERILR